MMPSKSISLKNEREERVRMNVNWVESYEESVRALSLRRICSLASAQLYLSHYSNDMEGDHGPFQAPNFSRSDVRGRVDVVKTQWHE